MSFLRTNYGGIFTPARYEANMAKVQNIPHFVTISDYYSGMETYRSLAEERNFWQISIPRPPNTEGPYDHNRLSAVLWLRSRIVRDDMKAFRMKLSTMSEISFDAAVTLLDTEIKAIENIDEENGLVLQAQPAQDRIMVASSRPAFVPNRSQGQQSGQTTDTRICHSCGKSGHISRFCPSTQTNESQQKTFVPFQKIPGNFQQNPSGYKGNNPWKPYGGAAPSHGGPIPICDYCKKTGHVAPDCRRKKSDEANNSNMVGNKRPRFPEAKPFERKQWVRIHDPRTGQSIRTDKASFQRDHAKARLAIDEQATAQLCVEDQEQYESNNEEDDTEDIELEEDFVLDDYTAQEE
jgi:hypothetical protein